MMKQLRKQRNLGMYVIYKIQSNHFYFRLNVSINFSSMYKIFNNFLRIAFIIVRFYFTLSLKYLLGVIGLHYEGTDRFCSEVARSWKRQLSCLLLSIVIRVQLCAASTGRYT